MADVVCAQNFFLAKGDEADFASDCIEAINTVLEGLEPYEYATLPTKTSIRLLSFERDEEWTYSLSPTVFELDQSPPFDALSYARDTPHQCAQPSCRPSTGHAMQVT
jgi:hypothetical protein